MSQLSSKLSISLVHLAVLCLSLYFAVHWFSVVSVLVFLALMLCLFYQYGRKKGLQTLPMLLVALGIFLGQVGWQIYQEGQAPQTVTKILLLPDTIKVNGDVLSFQGKVGGQTVQAFYSLASQEEQRFFKKVSQPLELTVEAEVTEAESQRNFNGFDYRAYLRTQGIYRTVTVDRLVAVKRVRSWNPFVWLSSWRRAAIVHVHKYFPAPMSHYMTGLLFGELDSEFEQMSDIYSSLGIIHLFALSGMQVGFFIDKIRYLLLRLGLKRETVDKLQYPISLVYGGLTGFSMSVVRSLIQKLLGNAGVRGLDNVALTVLICIVFLPSSLLTTGGILSFAYALILSVFDTDGMSADRKLFMESLVLSLGILPLLLFYFYSFQPLSIPLTLVFSVIFDSFMLPVLTLLFLLSPVLVIAQVNVVFVWLEKVIGWVFVISPRALVLGKPSLLVLLALLVILGLAYDLAASRKKLALLLLFAGGLFFLTKHPLENEVTVLDIGQGDSIFLRDMWGKTILIDTGGKVDFGGKEDWQIRQTDSNAERTSIPYLKSRGVGKIDQLVLTHTEVYVQFLIQL